MTTTAAPTSTRCARCGRTLTDPRSVAAGVGPTCRRRITARAATVITSIPTRQLDKALDLIAEAGIVRTNRATFTVISSNGLDRYTTTPASCTCPAGLHHRDCYHRVAATLIAA